MTRDQLEADLKNQAKRIATLVDVLAREFVDLRGENVRLSRMCNELEERVARLESEVVTGHGAVQP